MPIYSYSCTVCKSQIKKLMTKKQDTIPCECGAEMNYQLPTTVESVTYEKKDPHRGVQLPKNNAANLKKRMTQHHNTYEISKKIDEFGMDDAVKHGWIKKEKL